MTIRFQADADLNQVIVAAVLRREPAIDFQSATEGRLAGLTDEEVLAKASDESRIVVTHDQKTMPKHFAEFIALRRSSGLIVVQQSLPVAVALEELLLIHGVTDAVEWINRIAYIPI